MSKAKVYELEIKVEVLKTKEGKDFNAYKVLNNEGRYMDLKFRKEVTPPKESGLIYVDADKMSVDKKRKFPCVWVHEINSFTPFSKVRGEDKKVDELFGGNDLVDDELDPGF